MVVDGKKLQLLQDVANKLRIHSIKMTDASNSGHPTSCCSMAELTSVLFFHTMKYKVGDPRDPNSDRFVLSKGHSAPILYAAWAEAGLFPVENLLDLRKITSDLEGHPTPRLSFVDVATGSLGQGLGAAAGIAYLGKYIEKSDYRVYCLMGDGETAEGSVWEAAFFASQYKLDNLVAIVDVNRLAQSDPAPLGHDMETYKSRWASFGFNSIVVDGHDVGEIIKAFDAAKNCKDKPTAVLAKTFKGFGISGVSDLMGWHGKALGGSVSENARNEIEARISSKSVMGKDLITSEQEPNGKLTHNQKTQISLSSPPSYQKNQLVATRAAYGTALEKLGANERVVALDADVKNSTFSDKFAKKYPGRFVDCFISEQNMVSVAIGMCSRNRTVPFVSTFAAFLSRSFDQLRMGAVSFTSIKLCGSHVGVSIGEDGPSQMALEDLGMFRSIPGCTVFYPSDAVSMERAVELAANTPGMAYIRSSRPNTPVIYDNNEKFEIGKAKVVSSCSDCNILLIGAGVTLHEIFKANEDLKSHGLVPCIVDLFTVKPIDKMLIAECARKCSGRVVTVEDHYKEGGIFEAVSSSLADCRDITIHGIYIKEVPRSGSPDELMDKFGISAKKIAETVKNLKF